MCASVWVDFDMNLMGAGAVIFLIQTAFVAVLALAPRNRLVSGVVDSRLVLPMVN